MAVEGDYQFIKTEIVTEDSCSQEWIPSLNAVKEEDLDVKVKLENEITLDEEDEDPLKIDSSEILQDRSPHTASCEESPIFTPAGVTVQSEDGFSHKGNLMSTPIQNGQNILKSEGTFQATSHQIATDNQYSRTEDIPADVKWQFPHEETVGAASSKENIVVFLEHVPVKLEDGFSDEENYQVDEERGSQDIMKCTGNSEVLSHQVTGSGKFSKMKNDEFFETPFRDVYIAEEISNQIECRNAQTHNSMSLSSAAESFSTTCSDETPLSCAESRAQIKSQHLKIASEEKQHVCQHCSARFRRPYALKSHLLTHSSVRAFSCTQCSAKFKSSGVLKRHLATIHCDQRLFPCTQCPKTFKESAILKRHMVTHCDERPFCCTQCSARFKFRRALTLHSKTHSKGSQFFCLDCSAGFTSSAALKAHSMAHPDQKLFSCPLCLERFKHKFELEQHLKIHPNQKPFSCSQCSVSFRRMRNLRKHLLTHSDTKLFSCSLCAVAFKYKSSLKRHLLTHPDENQFSCSECSAKLPSIHYLLRHLKSHSEKAFSCGKCSAQFATKTACHNHLKSHVDEKIVHCQHCSAQFKCEYNLHCHTKLAHGIKR